MDSSTLLVVAVVAIAVMGAVWFGIKFWLTSTRPANIRDVSTPALDRLNRAALEGTIPPEEDEEENEEEAVEEEDDEADEAPDDDAPRGLKDVVPGEKPKRKLPEG